MYTQCILHTVDCVNVKRVRSIFYAGIDNQWKAKNGKNVYATRTEF